MGMRRKVEKLSRLASNLVADLDKARASLYAEACGLRTENANVRRERDEAVRHLGEARAKVAELETCYKNACGTIQRQADKIEKLYSSRNWNLSAALRCSERMALAAEELQGVCGATSVGKVVQAVEKALELLTAGEEPPPPMLDAEDEAARSRGDALMRKRDERVLADFPKVVVGGEEP